MKKLSLFALAVTALVSLPAHGQQVDVRTAVLAYSWDMDGEAADADQIVTTANGDFVDSHTYTITAQPDSCRLIDMTVTDANSSITVGTVTFTGTDCLGHPRVCVFDFGVVATRGSGVKTLPVTVGPTGASCYLGAVTSVVTSALTGEGGAGVDFFSAGYTTNSADAWTMYGIPGATDSLGRHYVDPWGFIQIPLNITTSGASTTAVTSVAANAAFTNVAAGDLLYAVIGTKEYVRKVVTRTDANNIVVNSALLIPAAGVPFRIKHFYYSTDPYDEMWIQGTPESTLLFTTNVAANADTGGVVQNLYCTTKGPGWPTTGNTTIATETTASAATARYAHSIDLNLLPFTHCRMAFKFGTGDDADAANEDISLTVTERRY
jgi:hypothetical protein